MADVFISYSREDKEKIIPIVEGFKSIGLTVWHDAKVPPGASFDEIIGSELDAAKAILVCWSPVSVSSKWVKSEASVALDQNTIICCFVEPCVLRPPFTMTQAEDLTTWNGSVDHLGWRKIVEQVGQLVKRPGLVPLLDAKAGSQPEKLADWAATYPDDPYATEIWSVWEAKERERLADEMQSLRQQFDAQIKQRKSVLHDKIVDFENVCNLWISGRRGANSGKRPVAPDLADEPSAQVDGVTEANLETKLKNSTNKVSDLEARLSATLESFEELKRTSGHSPTGRKAFQIAAALIFGLIGGFGLSQFSSRECPAPSPSVAEQIKSLTAERDAASKSLNEIKAAATANEQKFSQQQTAFESKLREANVMRDAAVEDAKNAKSSVVELQKKWDDANRQLALLNPKKDDLSTPIEKTRTQLQEIIYSSYYNLDLIGGDFNSISDIDLQGCAEACRNKSICLAYTYNKWARLCLLKSAIGVLTLNPRSITGVRTDLPAPAKSNSHIDIELHRNKRFPGDGYKHFAAESRDECESSCKKEGDSCMAYTFFNDNKICYFFRVTNEYFTDTSAFSGAKKQSP